MDYQQQLDALVKACSEFDHRTPADVNGNAELVVRHGVVVGNVFPHDGAGGWAETGWLNLDRIRREFDTAADKGELLARWKREGGGDIVFMFHGLYFDHFFRDDSPEAALPLDWQNLYRLWCHRGESAILE